MRRRYKRAQRISALLGGLAGAAVAITDVLLADLALKPRLLVEAVALVAGGAAVPWMVVDWLWRRKLRANFWQSQ